MAPRPIDAPSAEGRFAFGRNWRRFLDIVDEERIAAAEASLTEAHGADAFREARFLDVGCGSGLFSLAARRLGARVRAFDLDPESVACARELKRRFRPEDPDWTVEIGSVLDEEYLDSLGPHDIVYAWGVLHHTGEMWRALELAAGPVAPGGVLHVSVYNDQGPTSRPSSGSILARSLPSAGRWWAASARTSVSRASPATSFTSATRSTPFGRACRRT